MDWAGHNARLFGGLLRPPVLALVDGPAELGCWVPQARSLALSRDLVLAHSWVVVGEVLKHEMAHQFVDEVLGAPGEPPHGPTFQRVCAQRGIDGADRGVPTGSGPEPRILRKVRRLLALAESPEEHEAQAAAAAARRLLLRHELDLVSGLVPRSFHVRQLGLPRQRLPVYVKVLAGILAAHFCVEAIWVPAWSVRRARSGWVLEISGSPSAIDTAAYVWDFVLSATDRLWIRHRAAEGLTGNQHRRSYRAGVVLGFREQLDADAQASADEGLVWTGDPALQDWLARRHPHREASASVALTADPALASGRRQGRVLVVHKGISAEDGPSAAPPALGDPRAATSTPGRTP